MERSSVAPMMTHLWSPMAAVSSAWQGKHNAQIAVAIGAASIVPSKPRVIIQIYKRNFSHDLIYRSGAFAVNYLREDQLDLISALGLVSGRDKDKLSDLAYDIKASGSPVLEDCWGYLDCRVTNVMDGGDMTCFLGEVLDGKIFNEEGPLWWRDAARRLPASVIQEWDRKINQEIEFSTTRMDQIDFSPWTPGERPPQE